MAETVKDILGGKAPKSLYEANKVFAASKLHRAGIISAEYRTQWVSGACLFEDPKRNVFYTVKADGEIVKH